ncbi:hypothetical protein ON010_g12887 [Phytophthora cinnamomi]|nr:hypothetical protein ON010_g12887 [Phytophthora cinnamomi]
MTRSTRYRGLYMYVPSSALALGFVNKLPETSPDYIKCFAPLWLVSRRLLYRPEAGDLATARGGLLCLESHGANGNGDDNGTGAGNWHLTDRGDLQRVIAPTVSTV